MNRRNRVIYILDLSITFLLWPIATQAQPSVVSVEPRQNEINATVNQILRVRFSEPMNAASLNAATWLVYGMQTGFYSGRINYDPDTRTAEFVPGAFFKDGERVHAILTPGVQSAGGQILVGGFQWSFVVRVEYGTGVFDERLEIPLPEDQRDPMALFAADLNNDHFIDLAVANNATNKISVYLNDFTTLGGTFLPPRSFPAGNGPVDVTGGDFTGDGFVDLAVANFHDNTITVLTNDKTGRFFRSQTLSTDEHPVHLTCQDFDNDGRLDLAVVILGVNRFQIFFNQGSGAFSTTPSIYNAGASPLSLAPGDFDRDGDFDLVVANSGDNNISVFKNAGTGQFAFFGDTPVGEAPAVVATADLIGRSDSTTYGDGHLDLVLVHTNNNSVTLLDNRSRDGSFSVYDEMPVGLRPLGMHLADVDTFDAVTSNNGLGGDHDIDLAVVNLFSQDVNIIRNQANNAFTNRLSDVYEAGSNPAAITGGDFDRDGDIDLAVVNLGSQTISILLNRGGRSGGLRFGTPAAVLDFGEVYVGDDSTRTFDILNTGDEPVTLEDISTTHAVFSVSQNQAVIPPGDRFSLDINFAPTDTLLYQESLLLRTNVSGNVETSVIGLRGRGLQALIAVVPDTLFFGVVTPPQTRTLPIEVQNLGNGALYISELRFSNPAFSTSTQPFSLSTYAQQPVEITFAPAADIAYQDTLILVNSDPTNPEYPVLLFGSGSNQYPPRITSADSVQAVEDVFFEYVATATDSDGTQPRFIFERVPSWLAPASFDADNNVLEGTPREGDVDTTFVVIATDGALNDTLSVFVDVVPVNDPPTVFPVADQTVIEQRPLNFTVRAHDPEDSTLAFSATGLPSGAVFQDRGDDTAAFSWTPPLGSAGIYDVTIVVTEVVAENPLSDTTTVRITVQESLPDLEAALDISDTDITEHETRLIRGIVRNNGAPVDTSFRVVFYHDNQFVRDTVITSLDFGQETNFTCRARFDQVGPHEIRLEVDEQNAIQEEDETNNSAILRLQVRPAKLVVRPNPFTPNDDGFNDRVEFDFRELALTEPALKIFNFNGALLTILRDFDNARFRWNGRDASGRSQQPGIYLYILNDGGKTVTSGYVVLAR